MLSTAEITAVFVEESGAPPVVRDGSAAGDGLLRFSRTFSS